MISSGISSIDKEKSTREQYEVLGNSIFQEQSQQLTTQLQVFQNLLLNYSRDHSKEITENPKFRSEFSKICQSFGLDPLVSSSSSSSSKVKNDEFYYQLCIRIIEVCQSTKDINGGIILVVELVKLLNNNNNNNSNNSNNSNNNYYIPQQKVTQQDIITAIGKLQILGDEIKLINIGSKQYLKTIPQDLNQDENLVLDTCNVIGGYITLSILRDNFEWDQIRCQSVLEEMVSNGLLWIDEDPGVVGQINYWIPTWINE